MARRSPVALHATRNSNPLGRRRLLSAGLIQSQLRVMNQIPGELDVLEINPAFPSRVNRVRRDSRCRRFSDLLDCPSTMSPFPGSSIEQHGVLAVAMRYSPRLILPKRDRSLGIQDLCPLCPATNYPSRPGSQEPTLTLDAPTPRLSQSGC